MSPRNVDAVSREMIAHLEAKIQPYLAALAQGRIAPVLTADEAQALLEAVKEARQQRDELAAAADVHPAKLQAQALRDFVAANTVEGDNLEDYRDKSESELGYRGALRSALRRAELLEAGTPA